MKTEFDKGFRSVYSLTAHIIFVTKYRRPLLTQQMMDRLEEIFSETLAKWECSLVEFNGESDHVHLLVKYHPQIELSKLIANLKTVSSRLIRRDYRSQIEKYFSKPVLWTGSYFVASCGGVTVAQLKKYVQAQNTPSDNSPHR
ncbi:MAG: IS200/IS605 family transposase [Acaryochloridaceae cyanobacterium RL_2_7]|nr:IS200/IS605 family transposase [Acaryochloridaceae cyanobacterium RL_2_7]